MWIKWVTIHESYGLPRVAQEYRHYLERRGIHVRLLFRKTRKMSHVYILQVPAEEREQALEWLRMFKARL
ncbi:hypothetical protein KDJ56_13815 [Brevibacillus composti]|uniref:DUF2129 domain-containing protein n=1 Tax=Brevibacillus composti TaxID=2796470 RepID=A0A7T5JM68_9BACL|nr:hypothetical protein [Brevibacillus composti]QQE73018.1 hypothetical protein JD108_13870 [Brevibacillus composti]QUO40096.1 hypothetical protein KDJ56_13815 [Brevibacillus composti]